MIGVPSRDVWYMLRHLGYEGDLYIGHDPDAANLPYVAVRDTGGSPNPKWLRDEFTLQFRGKSTREDYAGGYAQLQNIKNKLLGVYTITMTDVVLDNGAEGVKIDDTLYYNYQQYTGSVVSEGKEIDYIRFLVMSDVIMIGQDDKNNYIFSLNMEVTREERQNTENRQILN